MLLLALALRLHGIHDPILDHPGWRQGDTAAIARNFARLQFDIMYPQTIYNGPPPNYVELELQIVPFLAASLYKIFGVHEIFGRLLTMAFSLATVVTLAYFARWLFRSALAGLIAAFFYAVFPGSVYYGRTFMPDCAMVFFLTAALYAVTRYLVEDDVFTLARLNRKHRASYACLSREAGGDVRHGAAARTARRAQTRRAPDAAARLSQSSSRFRLLVLTALRSPRRLARGVALDQRHHATARSPGIARRFDDRAGLHS